MKFMEAKTKMESLIEEKEKIINNAANTLAGTLQTMNNKGVSDVRAISNDIGKLLSGFDAEEKNQIMTIALAKLTVNL